MTSPIDLNPRSLRTVKQILADHVPQCEVRAYGSRAKWEAKDYSDLDLAVVGDGPTDPRILGDLREAFEESDLPIRVDVVDWHTIDDAFRSRIEADCVVIQQVENRTTWPLLPLGELVNNFDSRRVPLSRRERSTRPGPYPYYGATGVMDYIDDYLFEDLHLLVGEDGSVETPTGTPYVQLVDGRFWVNNHAHILQGSDDDETRFLYYALSATQIRPFVSGSVQAKLTQANLNRIPVPYPKHASDRRAVTDVLGALDRKIELNQRMSETLDEMARALFRSWFVDFDPVHAKAEGRPSGLPPDLDKLFPDSFEPSELGRIPSDWTVGELGDIVELSYGKALKAQDRQFGCVPVYGSNGQVGWHNESLVNGPGVIVGRKGNPGIVRWSHTDFYPIDTTFYVVPRDSPAHLHFLFFALEAQDLPSVSADSAVPGLSRRLAYMNKQVMPPNRLVSAFEERVRPPFTRARNAMEESRTLATLRDALLPRLLSGELRVPTAGVG